MQQAIAGAAVLVPARKGTGQPGIPMLQRDPNRCATAGNGSEVAPEQVDRVSVICRAMDGVRRRLGRRPPRRMLHITVILSVTGRMPGAELAPGKNRQLHLLFPGKRGLWGGLEGKGEKTRC